MELCMQQDLYREMDALNYCSGKQYLFNRIVFDLDICISR